MEEAISIHEMRRKAPLHFLAKADNARFAAYVVHSLGNDAAIRFASDIDYGGTPSVGLYVSFLREAAIALELIVKAVIAQRIESGVSKATVTKVRATHDLLALWEDAGLQTLQKNDLSVLLDAKRVLYWSGRYAAPKSDKDSIKEEETEDSVVGRRTGGTLADLASATLHWDAFSRIYLMAATEFWKVRG